MRKNSEGQQMRAVHSISNVQESANWSQNEVSSHTRETVKNLKQLTVPVVKRKWKLRDTLILLGKVEIDRLT